MLKKAANLRRGYGRQASGVPCLRRASFAEVATKAESGFAQAGRQFAVLTYRMYAPRANKGAARRDGRGDFWPCWTDSPPPREDMFFEHARWPTWALSARA